MDGTLEDTFYNFSDGTTSVLLKINGNVRDDLNSLKGQKVKAEIKKWRRRRSLTANAYYWELVGKLSKHFDLDNIQTHNQMLRRYSEPWVDENGDLQCWYIPADVDLDHMEDTHFGIMETGVFLKGKPYVRVCLLVPSHLMDAKQMGRLIDGVVGECKAAKIETIPPDELERLLSSWRPKSATGRR